MLNWDLQESVVAAISHYNQNPDVKVSAEDSYLGDKLYGLKVHNQVSQVIHSAKYQQ